MKLEQLVEAKAKPKAALAVPKMEHPGVKVSVLQGLRTSLEKAVKKLGYHVEQGGFEEGSTVWSVAFAIPKKFNITDFEDKLREELHLEGWLRVKFFDLVEE
jgi:hypothetical protein